MLCELFSLKIKTTSLEKTAIVAFTKMTEMDTFAGEIRISWIRRTSIWKELIGTLLLATDKAIFGKWASVMDSESYFVSRRNNSKSASN